LLLMYITRHAVGIGWPWLSDVQVRACTHPEWVRQTHARSTDQGTKVWWCFFSVHISKFWSIIARWVFIDEQYFVCVCVYIYIYIYIYAQFDTLFSELKEWNYCEGGLKNCEVSATPC
jgi:hypothetical protein